MADYASILAAIDAAIASGAAGPVEIRSLDGRYYKYNSLADLIAARRHFAALQQSRQGLKIGKFQSGSARL